MESAHKIAFENTEYLFYGESNDAYFIDLPTFNTDNFHLEAFLAQNQTKAFNCLDVGANIGLTAVLMAHYNPNGNVYAFEPGPLNFKNLSRNILENPLSNLYAIEKAVGSGKGFVNFNIPACGAHSTVLRLEPNNQNYAKVEIVSLDEWIVETNIGSIDLIKIDVEGFEAEVLKGAANTIFMNKPYV